jgi:hypothetical protein
VFACHEKQSSRKVAKPQRFAKQAPVALYLFCFWCLKDSWFKRVIGIVLLALLGHKIAYMFSVKPEGIRNH